MSRNLSRRVEAAAPVEDRASRERLWEILETCLQDRRQAWELQADGSYVRLQPPEGAAGAAAVGTHEALMESARRRAGP
jgi:polyphosphate kinase